MPCLRLPFVLLCLAPAAVAQPGTLDPSFGDAGQVTLSAAPPQGGGSVVALPDGRLLVAGSQGGDAAVYRFTRDGALDPAFGQDGVAVVDLGDEDRAVDLAVQSSGRVVVAANANVDGTVDRGVLFALTADGALDGDFGTSGLVAVADDGGGVAGLALDASDRVVVAVFDGTVQLARYSAGGALDAGFGADGRADTGVIGLPGRPLAVPGGGAVLVGLRFSNPPAFQLEPFVARVTASGALDGSFAGDGVLELDFGGTFDGLLSAALDGQGRIVAVGLESDLAAQRSALVVARITAAGALDASFAGDGTASSTLGQPLAQGAALAVLPDGRIVVGGVAGTAQRGGLAVARLLPDGALDPAFGDGGSLVLGSADDESVTGLAIQPGRIVAVGSRGNVAEPPTALRMIAVLNGDATATAGGPAPAVALALAGPNPTAGPPRIRLTLAAPELVRVVLADALGRTVAVLHDGPLAEGAHTLTTGADLAGGLYWVRATVGAQVAALGVTVAR